MRLYVKTLDNGLPVKHYSIRLEATLFQGGCQNAGVSHICLLPTFVKDMRRFLSPFFNVAAGIKPKIKRTRARDPKKVLKAAHEAEQEQRLVQRNYRRYGPAWAAKHRYNVVSDKKASKMIGGALKTLREHLLDLKLPTKSAGLAAERVLENAMYQALADTSSTTL